MEFDAVLIPARRAQSVAQGFWPDRTINDELDACVAACPDKLALTAVQAESGTTTRFTYRELAAMADRVAVGLTKLGVGKNDIVACQLPNWWQFTVVYLACSRIGAVMNPLMHIFRERELSFMLQHGEAKLLIVPKVFRGFDYEQMVTALKPSLPHLQHIVVVNGTGANSFEALLSGPAWENDPQARDIITRQSLENAIAVLMAFGGSTNAVLHLLAIAHEANVDGVPDADLIRRALSVAAEIWEGIGEIDDSQKPEFLGNARALLFPIDWPEPFGLVMIEAMAAGTAVIASKVPTVTPPLMAK